MNLFRLFGNLQMTRIVVVVWAVLILMAFDQVNSVSALLADWEEVRWLDRWVGYV